MYVRVCACVGQTLLSYAQGLPAGTEDVPPTHTDTHTTDLRLPVPGYSSSSQKNPGPAVRGGKRREALSSRNLCLRLLQRRLASRIACSRLADACK